MEPLLIFSLFCLFIIGVILIGTYNNFIKYKNRIEEAWSSIDVALKRRFNLIPNLIRVIEGYSEHEAKILMSNSNQINGTSTISNRVEEESHLSKSLQGALALAEAYPDLKASANFIDLQNTLDGIERDIQNARNRYNRAVNKFNTMIESFPASLIAKKYKFEKQSYFALDLATQRESPEANFTKPRKQKFFK